MPPYYMHFTRSFQAWGDHRLYTLLYVAHAMTEALNLIISAEHEANMTSVPPERPIGPEKPSVCRGQPEFSTLKEALSASFPHAPQPTSLIRQDSTKDQHNGDMQSSHPNTSRNSLFIDMPPKIHNTAEVAFTALQYLPTPLLVLSSLKLVVLANEAFGRLLGLDTLQESPPRAGDDEKEQILVAEMLRGQSLSQIGIDMVQDGQQVWVSWEV